jgi:cytochrome c oxidase cbb3-type subunit 2
MNTPPLIVLGILFTLVTSVGGLLIAPQLQIGHQVLVEDKSTGSPYPSQRNGYAAQGQQIYRSLGCAECHTRQVRAAAFGTDVKRGWGPRFTVAQDYLQDYPVMLGSLRLGPDLMNIGARLADEQWHLKHLYNPRLVVPGSIMPRYTFLFEERKLKPGEKLPRNALDIDPALTGGKAIIRTTDSDNLLAYLLSQRAVAPLFESPLPGARTNAPAGGGTNAPAAGSTNAPAAGDTNAPAPTNQPAPAK